MMDVQSIVTLLEGVTYLIAIAGVLRGIALYSRSLEEERQRVKAENERHEWAVYEAVRKSYVRFLEFSITTPKVGVTLSEADTPAATLSEEQRVLRDLLFDYLATVFQDAFLLYSVAKSDQRERQWEGWERFITAYCQRTSFREWWRSGSDFAKQYDLAFEKYIDERVAAQDAVR